LTSPTRFTIFGKHEQPVVVDVGVITVAAQNAIASILQATREPKAETSAAEVDKPVTFTPELCFVTRKFSVINKVINSCA